MNKIEIKITILDFDIDKYGNEIVTIEIDDDKSKIQKIYKYGDVIVINSCSDTNILAEKDNKQF